MTDSNITRAILTKGGQVLIEQPLLTGACHLLPRLEGVGAQCPLMTRFEQMSAAAEQISNLTVHREKPLHLSG